MDDTPEILSAAQLDAMTPAERAASFDASIITNLDDVPEPFRSKVIATGQRLERERREHRERRNATEG